VQINLLRKGIGYQPLGMIMSPYPTSGFYSNSFQLDRRGGEWKIFLTKYFNYFYFYCANK